MITAAEALAQPAQPPEPVRLVADRCRRLAAAAAQLAEDVRFDRTRLHHAWSGGAAIACDAELQAVADLLHLMAEVLARCALLLRAHADEVEHARRAVDALRREYDEVVARAGCVAAGPWQLATELRVVHAGHQALLDGVDAEAARTAAGIRGAVEAVVPTRRRDWRLALRLPLLRAARSAAPPGGVPSSRSAPERVATWWDALTTDERDELLGSRPRVLGSLAGVPVAVRGAANDLLLARDLARQRRTAGTVVRGARAPWVLGTSLAVTDALAYVRAHRDPVTGRPMTASLLVYRPGAFHGQGRVAVVAGDLEHAQNVALLVPGLGSTVGGSVRDLTAAAVRITRRARTAAPEEVTATVAWMAYDAPNLLQVGADGSARRGARLLAADVRGLRAGHSGHEHLTVVGHSYGSTTAGIAGRTHLGIADEIVLLGSPGAGVERAAELHVPGGHVWVGAGSRDPVSYLDRFGTDPTHERFGAVRFRAEDAGRHPFAVSLADHSHYLRPGSESLDNVARVVVGHAADVTLARYRGETAWLPDGIATDPEADRPVRR